VPIPDRLIADAMRAAIEESEQARGTTSPNPPVGCVILAGDGSVAGSGHTAPPGGPHAEITALRAAGAAAAGGTAVVTLEPCAHTGRTGPCAQALIDAGVAAVHYAVTDPNPKAAGGAETLRAAGVDVQHGPLSEDVQSGPLRAWLHFARTGRPHITWKYAASLDGRVAAADGTSRWISSPDSRAEVHRLRTRLDAIVAGRGTVLRDDPQLTARTPDGGLAAHQPLRVVVGTGDLPAGARVLDDSAPTLQLRTREPADVIAELAERECVDVLLEGGPRLAGAFLRAGCVDRVLAYVAPTVLGAGPAALADAGVATITQALPFRVEGASMCGPDVRISAVPVGEY
jgi:diaminohydroxyphosphoribosylaminopyrimidine deaminase/5-amino-6-(5-phosphoribosylamino)uracil reductase